MHPSDSSNHPRDHDLETSIPPSCLISIEPDDTSTSQVPDTMPLLSKPENSKELQRFRVGLEWCALDHSTWLGKSVSFFTFIFLAVLVPLATSLLVQYEDGSLSNDPISFNKLVQLPQSALALIGFFNLARFFRKYSLGELLFLDGLEGDSPYVQRGYRRELARAFGYLACILLPSFIVELAHKIVFFSKVTVLVPYITSEIVAKVVVGVLVLWSWIYRTGVFLLICVLFRLTCELQILRFEGFKKRFEGRGSDPSVIFNEHLRIRTQLSATSHRYRCFIIGGLVIITVSQFAALLLVLASTETKTFFNSGDLIVFSAAELSGFCLCLLGAAKITHRAQGIASVATQWHMTVSSALTLPDHSKEANGTWSDHNSESESDHQIDIPSSKQLSPFQIRQTLVAYLQHNSRGITVYGYALDRGALHTLFAFEFSLVLWILSKVVVLSSS